MRHIADGDVGASDLHEALSGAHVCVTSDSFCLLLFNMVQRLYMLLSRTLSVGGNVLNRCPL